jgi:hypothetical protein
MIPPGPEREKPSSSARCRRRGHNPPRLFQCQDLAAACLNVLSRSVVGRRSSAWHSQGTRPAPRSRTGVIRNGGNDGRSEKPRIIRRSEGSGATQRERYQHDKRRERASLCFHIGSVSDSALTEMLRGTDEIQARVRSAAMQLWDKSPQLSFVVIWGTWGYSGGLTIPT